MIMLLACWRHSIAGFLVCSFLAAMPLSAAVDDVALMEKRPAKRLSEFGLFVDGPSQTPAEGVVPYDLIMPLFTDYAHKYRFVYVPNGLAAVYKGQEVFDFPVGSVLVKTFAYPADFRKPEENVRLIETRLLIHQPAGWASWAYVWNEGQTEAVLKVAGKTLPVSWIDETGTSRSTDYIVPNKNQCKGCHTLNKKLSPIGPKARNLNHEYDYKKGAENQLLHWNKRGILSDIPPYASIERVPALSDASANIQEKARAYMDVNCAHCHRVEGPASTSGLFLTYYEANQTALGIRKRPVAAGRGAGNFIYDIAPGNADQSIMIYRLQSLDPGIMMPELGRTMVHREGVLLLKGWINSLPE